MVLNFLRDNSGKFTPRSASRDRENDEARREKIVQAIANAIDQLRYEQKGLADRYDRASESAGMALQIAEGEGSSRGVDTRLDELERSVTYYAHRIEQLKAQLLFYERLRADAEDFDIV